MKFPICRSMEQNKLTTHIIVCGTKIPIYFSFSSESKITWELGSKTIYDNKTEIFIKLL